MFVKDCSFVYSECGSWQSLPRITGIILPESSSFKACALKILKSIPNLIKSYELAVSRVSSRVSDVLENPGSQGIFLSAFREASISNRKKSKEKFCSKVKENLGIQKFQSQGIKKWGNCGNSGLTRKLRKSGRIYV